MKELSVSNSKKKSRAAKTIRKYTGRFSIFGELWSFMRVRKKWWLGPILTILILLAVFIVLTQGTALAPFIYSLF
jgi:hypothetical protein